MFTGPGPYTLEAFLCFLSKLAGKETGRNWYAWINPCCGRVSLTFPCCTCSKNGGLLQNKLSAGGSAEVQFLNFAFVYLIVKLHNSCEVGYLKMSSNQGIKKKISAMHLTS